jgi:transcriptional regulator with XRE-family HTH domain
MPRSPFNLTRSVKLARSDVRALEHRAHVEGRRVSAARVALGLTQEQLAARVYVGRRMIAGVESGELALEPDGLARFARALGLTPSDLMHSSRLARARADAALLALARLAPEVDDPGDDSVTRSSVDAAVLELTDPEGSAR